MSWKKAKKPNSFNLDYRKKTKDPPKNLSPMPRKEGRIIIETELSLQQKKKKCLLQRKKNRCNNIRVIAIVYDKCCNKI